VALEPDLESEIAKSRSKEAQQSPTKIQHVTLWLARAETGLLGLHAQVA
jgi:hypothetical protein